MGFKINIFTVLLLMTFTTAVSTPPPAPQSVASQTSAKIAQIIENEKVLHHIEFSDEENKKALAYFLTKKGITLSTFTKVAVTGQKIVDGLKLTVHKQQSPAEVYKQLDMSSFEISPEMWNYYVKEYSTDQKIKILEELIPDSMEKVINSGVKNFGQQLQSWLLYQKIIMDFDTKFPDRQKLSLKEKESAWWKIAIKKYNLPPELEKNILAQITLSQVFDDDTNELMLEFFKDKIK